MRRYWKIGFVFLILLVLFGPVNCAYFEGDRSNPTAPIDSETAFVLPDFYADRGLRNKQYGVYVDENEIVMNYSDAGRYYLAYQTNLGAFLLVFDLEEAALLRIGIREGDEVVNIWSDEVPDDISVPASTFQNIDMSNPDMTLLIKTRFIPQSITDISECEDQDCFESAVANWEFKTPDYTWPDGSNQGTLASLGFLGADTNAAAKTVLAMSSSSRAKTASTRCGGYNPAQEACETSGGIWDSVNGFCDPSSELDEDDVNPGSSSPTCSASSCSACQTQSTCEAINVCTWVLDFSRCE